jgi:hypothetical protein
VGAYLLALLLIAAAPAAAQVTAVQPGAIVTAAVSLPAAAGDSAHYRIEAEPGVALVSGSTGRLRPEATVLPITFTLSRAHAAGPMVAALVHVDGLAEAIPLEVLVGARHALAVRADSALIVVPASGSAAVRIQLRNGGNATDTVRFSLTLAETWRVRGLPPALVLPAGAEQEVTLWFTAPADAASGRQERALVTVQGTGGRHVLQQVLLVGSRTGAFSQFETLPLTLTASSPVGGVHGMAPSFEAAGSGMIGADTRVSFSWSRQSAQGWNTPLRGLTRAWANRLEVTGPGFRLAGGELFMPTGLSGRSRSQTGALMALGDGPTRGEIFIGADSGPVSFHTGASTDVAGARVGASIARQAADPVSGAQLDEARLHADMRTQLGHSRIEAGVFSMTGRGHEGAHPVLGLAHTVVRPGGSLVARLRLVGGLDELAAHQVAGDEASLRGQVRLSRRFDASAGYDRYALAGAGSLAQPDMRAATLGIGWSLAPLRLEVQGRDSRNTGRYGDFEQQTVSLRGTGPLLGGRLDLSGEVGRGNTLSTRTDVRRVRADYSISAAVGELWVSGYAGSDAWGSSAPGLELGARTSAGPVALSLGTALRGGSTGAGTSTGWVNAEVAAGNGTSVLLGTEYRAWSAVDPWTFALGVRSRAAAPLPVRRAAAIQGIVFEDTNGNLRHDPGERVVPGVRLLLGMQEAVSDENGRFRFAGDANGATLRVDAMQLPAGTMPAPGAYYPARGRVQVPLVSTADLTVIPTVAGDTAALSNVEIRVEGPGGYVRVGTTDGTGRAKLAAMPAGEYSVLVLTRPYNGATVETRTTIRLFAGPGVDLDVVVPEFRRSIRIQELPPAGTSPRN